MLGTEELYEDTDMVSCSDDNRNYTIMIVCTPLTHILSTDFWLLKKKCKLFPEGHFWLCNAQIMLYILCILQNKVKHYQLRHYHDVTYTDNQCKKKCEFGYTFLILVATGMQKNIFIFMDNPY